MMQLLRKMTDSATDSPVVCLYWKDYLDDQWQAACRRLGLRTVTAGRPDNWPHFGSRRTFLERLHAIISGSSEVIVNDFVTAMVYAADLRKPVKTVDSLASVTVTKAAYITWQDYQGELGRLRDEVFTWWNSLSGIDHAYEVAQVELGAKMLLSPEKLRERLGWLAASDGFRRRYDATLNVVGARLSRRRLHKS